jgi:hypothetical protein
MPPSPSIEPKFAIDDAGKVTGECRWLSPDRNVNGVYLPVIFGHSCDEFGEPAGSE